MKIIIGYTWSRGAYNNDTVVRNQMLEVSDKSKRGVTQAIRDWAKTWTGKGFVDVAYIDTTFGDDKKFCDIKQHRFVFNN